MELLWAMLPLFFAITALLVYMYHQQQLHAAERRDLLDRILRLSGVEPMPIHRQHMDIESPHRSDGGGDHHE